MDSDFRTRRSRLRGFSINRLIPNVLTLAALCSGLTAIRFGLQGQMRLAVIAIFGCLAAIGTDPRRDIDGQYGKRAVARIARRIEDARCRVERGA